MRWCEANIELGLIFLSPKKGMAHALCQTKNLNDKRQKTSKPLCIGSTPPFRRVFGELRP